MTDQNLDRSLFDLNGKVAVVTGGAGIQGQKITRGLAAFGADVAVVDIEGDAANDLARELRNEYEVRALGVRCDVSVPESVAQMTEAVCGELGGVHILHNNAATKTDNLDDFFEPFETFSLKTWREIMSVNIDGMFLVAQAVGNRMIEQGTGGSIIQTASTYGVVGPDQRIYQGSRYMDREINTPAVYSASKAAVIGLTRYLATYWADRNIRVNTLSPGGIASGQNDIFARNYASRTPLARMAEADETVGAVVFLASDASSYMTGHNLIVDGGWTAW